MKFSLIIIAFFSLLFSVECVDDNDEQISCIECLEYSDSAIDGWECIIDARDWEEWVYMNLFVHGEVDPELPEDHLGWDIAFRRFNFRTNSGLSGSGNGGAYVDSVNTWSSYLSFNQTTQVPENSYFERDTIVHNFYNPDEHVMYLPGIANPSLETWAWVDEGNCCDVHPTDNKFIVRSGGGDKFYKFWPNSYYENSDESGPSGKIRVFFNEIDPCSLEHDNCGECNGDNSSCSGCMDNTACNYDMIATIDEGCEYPDQDYDCNGTCVGDDNDNDGVCNNDDACPEIWDPHQNDRDQDGLADACIDDDDDGDGLIDCWDFWYNPNDGDIDGDGIADNFGIGCQDAALGLDNNSIVNGFTLYQNYPNPFNPSTSISYSISEPANVLINIFDINGKTIYILEKDFKNSGNYILNWDGKDNENKREPSGIYIYKLILNGVEADSKKMLLLY